MDYYEILNLKPGASAQEIKEAYKSLVKKHHPDVGGNPETLKQIIAAYEFLMNPENQRKYEERLKDQADRDFKRNQEDPSPFMRNKRRRAKEQKDISWQRVSVGVLIISFLISTFISINEYQTNQRLKLALIQESQKRTMETQLLLRQTKEQNQQLLTYKRQIEKEAQLNALN